MSLSHIALALLVVSIWGFNFVVIRWGLNELPPIFFSFMRFLAAALPLALVVRKPPVAWRWIIGFGTFQFALQFVLLFVGMQLGMPAGLSSLVMQLQVFFTMALAAFWLHERISLLQVVGALIAASGMVLVATQIESRTTLIGFVCLVAGAVSWAVANVISKRMPSTDAFALVVWASLVCCPMLLAASVLIEGPARIAASMTQLSWRGVFSIAFNGWAAAIVGFGLWNYLLQRYPAGTVAPYTLLVPVVGMMSAVMLLGEPLLWWKLTAGALVLSGLALNQWAGRRAATNAHSIK